MSGTWYAISRFASDSYYSTWGWLNSMDLQQWLTLLFVTMLIGFLCMRGFGSRKHY